MALSLGDRIEAARRTRFVGRTTEHDLFRQALTAEDLPFYVLHIFGPGGIGKTSLLQSFAHLAKEHNVTSIYIDSRELDATPERFLGVLHDLLHAPAPQTIFQFLASQGTRYIILLDTAELLAPLDSWLRNHFFPQLPANVLTVLASRNPPAIEWRADPGWHSFARIVQLRNLAFEESQSYLSKCQVPSAQHRRILDFTHGHPLALSLLADTFAQSTNLHFQPAETPDIITALIERFIEHVPSPLHRAALEASSLVRMMTEPLLAAMIESPNTHEIFAWLRTLSFVTVAQRGLFPHDLARDALCLELRWRNPERYAELHSNARRYYMAHFLEGNRQRQQNILYDYLFLHRDNPVVRPYFDWQEEGTLFVDSLQPTDQPTLVRIVEKHEGGEAARLAAYWLTRDSQQTLLFRDSAGQLQGLLLLVALQQVTHADTAIDPAVRAVHYFLQQNSALRPGDCATFFRFWMAQDTYQDVSLVQSRIFLAMVQHYLTAPNLAYTFLPCADPAFWSGVFAYADLQRLADADYRIGTQHYGVYGHDWRATPPLAWLTLLAEREIAMGIPHTPPPLIPTMLALSEMDFAEAVRNALRDFHNTTALRPNPLLRSSLLMRQVGNASDAALQIGTLRTLLQTAAAPLQETPRNNKLYRALYHTYFQPAATQEQAAELLDVPFSTYRRHLRAGIEYLIETLWQQELEHLAA